MSKVIAIDEIFRHRHFDEAALLAYGFELVADARFRYRTHVLDGAFELVLTIDQQGRVHYAAQDTETGEPYLPLEVENLQFATVQQLRHVITQRLLDIADRCTLFAPEQGEQVQRLMAAIVARWGVHPEPIFKRIPEASVFRHASGKWFALMLPIAWDKLSPGRNGQVIALNVKCRTETMVDGIDYRHIFPAYHMNKKHWLTIALDGDVADETVMAFIADSYALTQAKGG